MADDDKLQAKLRRLGVVKGARHLKPALSNRAPLSPLRPSRATPIEAVESLDTLLPGGRWQKTTAGQTFILDKVYPLHYQHGRHPLNALLQFSPGETAIITQDKRFHDLDFRHFLFLDTETTGLAGAGTIAFMVGVAFFDGDALIVRQYFVPDFGEEAAMLTLLDKLLADKTGLVTFNGRTFDIPLLDNRYLMNRMLSDLRERPHLDLLAPARRLWRTRLGSVALSALEPALLDVHRTQEDVPGFLIPGLYRDYVRSGDGREIVRVFYHNRIDLLSLVTLATHTIRQFHQPQLSDNPVDLYSLGKWQARLGLIPEAENNLKLAAQGDLPLDIYHKNLYELGWLLKRHDRRAEALPLWQQIAATSFDDVTAHIELAKYYEWHTKNLPLALRWTEQALTLIQTLPPTQSALLREELEHRRQRLQSKLTN
ncbi:MAG: hypothetical protein GY796_12245 [Chloroflexi bacterium]|nr:hypothetical protein [Chloroflexota bacterium]